MAPFVCPRSKTISLAPIHPFTKQMVPSLCPESLTRSLFRLFSPVLCARLIKGFLPPKAFLCARRLLLLSLFHFHRTLFVGLREPRKFLNQARAGHRPAHAWFLEITSVQMYVCVCVCVSAPEAMNN